MQLQQLHQLGKLTLSIPVIQMLLLYFADSCMSISTPANNLCLPTPLWEKLSVCLWRSAIKATLEQQFFHIYMVCNNRKHIQNAKWIARFTRTAINLRSSVRSNRKLWYYLCSLKVCSPSKWQIAMRPKSASALDDSVMEVDECVSLQLVV